MAMIVAHNPRPRGRGRGPRMLAFAVAACRALLLRRQQRAHAASLRSLDNRMLADIGMTPVRRDELSILNAPGPVVAAACAIFAGPGAHPRRCSRE